ncbi:MAG: hemerythrin domain-containing protein [Deltaproteobacteria bacterium]|nr:hemerythrin domain-containing protein [Deltaproteobacteria bacterium]
MNTIYDFLERDHRRLDDLFAGFRKHKARDPETALLCFTQFKRGLDRHIRWEEELLFPPFENATGMKGYGPTAVMRDEHRQIHWIVDQIEQQLLHQVWETDTLEAQFLEVMGMHNSKEEKILYPWLDEQLEGPALAEILRQLEHTAQLTEQAAAR